VNIEYAVDLNLILGIIFGLLGLLLVGLWISVPVLVFSMREYLNQTNRRLEQILSIRPEHILDKRCCNDKRKPTSLAPDNALYRSVHTHCR